MSTLVEEPTRRTSVILAVRTGGKLIAGRSRTVSAYLSSWRQSDATEPSLEWRKVFTSLPGAARGVVGVTVQPDRTSRHDMEHATMARDATLIVRMDLSPRETKDNRLLPDS